MNTYDIFNALAEPTRRDIIEMLATKGQLSASDISTSFKVSAPAISQHLKVLREARLVTMRRVRSSAFIKLILMLCLNSKSGLVK